MIESNNDRLLSHSEPRLPLQGHINQVLAAARFLLSGHSPQVRQRRPETAEVLDALVRCHDLGKGSPAFQDYIRDPARYRGNPRAKEHSALSAALAILWAKERNWAPLQTLALAQAVAGHHAGFATLDHLDERLLPDDDDVLIEQWEGLDRAALARAAGLDLEGVAGDFEDGRRWLFRRQRIEAQLQALPLFEGVRFRLWTQFLFALLLEADKAFLALREEKLSRYLQNAHPELPPEWVDTYLASRPPMPINRLRRRIREQVLSGLTDDHPCCTLTLPTGVGKTLLAASWALSLRRRMMESAQGLPPKIIIVLPYLSIIDQTEEEYRKLFGLSLESRTQSPWLMASHSLSQPQYELEGRRLGDRYTNFYLDTWRAEVILTTFDQLLLALFSSKTRHLMRFHPLMDALIILDEVQTLPCKLWDLVDHGLRALTVEGNSRILMMSATQPALLTEARELVGDERQVNDIFSAFRRYRITLRHRQDRDLDEFIAELRQRLSGWLEARRRVLVTLNTRASARTVWQAVREFLEDVPVYLISADITPRDRLAKITAVKAITAVKEGSPCMVISTQTVEAGVDIDMDITLRDFAPLDALIQVAGRCNRNHRLGEYGGAVEVVSLRSENGRRYADMIYDPVLLDAARQVLEGLETVGEEAVLALSRRYFGLLKERKDLGKSLTDAFARWRDMPDIRALLRGEAYERISFLILSDEDAGLREEMTQALGIEDRWERRSALRLLAAELQQRTVSIYTRPGFRPEDYAEPLGPFWILREGYYSSEGGLDLRLKEDNPARIF